MKDFVEYWVEPFLKLISFPAAILAAWGSVIAFAKSNEVKKRANAEAARANQEKDRENRHRQAAAGLATLKDIFASERARAAMQMLDWSGRSYRDGSLEHTIRTAHLGPALRVNNLDFSPIDRYIRDCFEDLYDHLELAQHCVSIGLLEFDDISVPLSYYCEKIADDLPAFSAFLDTYGYTKAKTFIIRAAKARKASLHAG